MFDWLQKTIGQRSSHPMNSPAEAARLLSELPLEEPLKAVEEVAAWLESLSHATSFATESRLKVISMVDEAGQPCAELLMAEFLDGAATKEAEKFRQWQALSDFWEQLAGAYQLIALQIEVSKRAELAELAALVAVRGMRAVSTQMRLGFMRYAGDGERAWSALCHLYQAAHALRRAAVPVRPYPWETRSTTARLELARAVMLEAAAPQSLPPRQIELTARVSAQVASSFAYGEAPGAGLPCFLDLAQGHPPAPVPAELQPAPTHRFFGPGAAPARLKELLDGLQSPEAAGTDRLGSEFTAAEKIEALRRLQLYWSDTPPRRQHARTRLAHGVDVVFGLDGIHALVGHAEQAVVADASDRFKVQFDDAGKTAAAPAAIETWKLKDISMHGLGAVTSRRAQGALRIGALMAFRIEGSGKWCVGIVRRLTTDGQNLSHVGAEIFSKNPQYLRLKKLGLKQDEAWNWEARDQRSLGHFAQAVMLPAGAGAADSLLFEPGSYYPEETFGVMVGNHARKLQLAETLEKGDGFERVAFRWLAAEAPPPNPAPPTPSAQSGGFGDQQQD